MDRLRQWRPIIVRVVGYPVAFLLFFVTFVYVTFPYDRLREAIEAAASAPRITPSGRTIPSTMEVTIGHLGPTVIPGLKARDVTVTFLAQHPGERPTTMRLDTATVHVSLLALVFTRTASVSFDVEGMGGEIDGSARIALTGETPGLRDLDVTLQTIRMGQIAPLVAMVGLPMGGSMSGTVEIHLPDGLTSQSEGAVHLTADRLTLGDGRAQFQIPHFGGITIEQIRAGRLDVGITIHHGAAVFDRVASHSEELDLNMDGRVDLRPSFGDSLLNIGLRFRLTDIYRHKSEQAGRILSVMDMVPDIRRARRPDGMMAFRCSGTVDRGVLCPPDPRGGTAGSTLGASP